jgi:hypothetical protein
MSSTTTKTGEAPAPVTKRRRWRAVLDFRVGDTPDPAYDVAACERLGDKLNDLIEEAFEKLVVDSPTLALDLASLDVIVLDDER